VSYRTTLLRLADGASAAMETLWLAFEAGTIGRDEFVARAAAMLAVVNARATTLADVALAATISVQLKRVIPTLGIMPNVDLDRLVLAAGTVAELGTIGRAVRLAHSEPLETAARAYSTGIRESPHVVGWERQTSGTACEMCTGWASAGVLPDTVPMNTHKGCSCIPIPVTEGAP
jgi:hypothetical protein